MTFEAVGFMGWETGSCRPGNIRIGLAVFEGVNLMVRPCFATVVQGLARPTLGKREDSRGKNSVTDSVVPARW